MTEAELWELNAIYLSNTMTAFNAYLSVVFAYLATAYFLGARLSRFQAAAVSGLFLFALSLVMFAVVTTLLRVASFHVVLKSMSDTYLAFPLVDTVFFSICMAVLMLIGLIVSVYFMYDIRRKARDD